ncbi:MAG: ASKHA domain-containing protein [bacterium]
MNKDTCKITILPQNKIVNSSKGANLLQELIEAGIHISASCGGQGTCGKCKVIIMEGEYNASATPFLSKREVGQGFALACLTLIEGDIKIFIPPQSLGIGKKIITASAGDIVQERWALGAWEIKPRTKSIHLKLLPPSLADNRSDLERLRTALAKTGLEARNIFCRLPLLRELSSHLRENNWEVTVIVMENCDGTEIIDLNGTSDGLNHYGLAIDVGTTTIVVYLINLHNGKVADTDSDYNAQIRCGEDIISRIVYAREETKLKELNDLVISTINGMIDRILGRSNIPASRIDNVMVVGNATMLHLLLGINPQYIRKDPYITTFSTISNIRGSDLGINVNPNAYLSTLPSISSYVGADIAAGVLATGIYKMDRLCVFIDIGTNGEMVVGNKDWLVAASCSAGPAFEGGEVKFGMRATSGAIENVKIDPNTLKPTFRTVNNEKAIGICGSGILDSLSEMFVTGILDRNGKIRKEFEHERIRASDDGTEYVLSWASENGIDEDIVITDVDINNIIRAKAAVYAALRVLLSEIGYSIDQIEHFMIAGGFGHCITIENAIILGLLPDLPVKRFRYLGNSTIVGAHLALISGDLKNEIETICQGITYIELSNSTKFMDEYLSALFLPHTDLTLFPMVKKIFSA